MEVPKTHQEHWQSVIDEISRLAERALSFTASRELDGDTTNGISEQCFKMLILGVLAASVSPTFADLEIESEREVEGGRIDLFMKDTLKNTSLVIELKYVRIGFLESTKGAFYLPLKQKFKAWEETDKLFHLLTKEEQLLVKVRRLQMNSKRGNHSEQVITVSGIQREADIQCRRYCKALRIGGIRQLNAEMSLYKVAIIGLGKNVVMTPVEEYVFVPIRKKVHT